MFTTLGQKLRVLRLTAGFSLPSDFAELYGFDRADYLGWEGDDALPSPSAAS